MTTPTPTVPSDPSPSPAPKRRKTSSALFKPFKSPFKTPLKPSVAQPAKDKDHEFSAAAAKHAETAAAAVAQTQTPTPPRPRPSAAQSPDSKPSAEVAALQRQHTALLAQLSALRTALDSHAQALKIESSARDAELTRLVDVWKAASRAAAEELYGGVRDRVNRMGGVAAWRERERDRAQGWGGGWDEARATDRGSGADAGDDQEDEGVAERREREGAEREGEEEMARARDGDRKQDDEGFTMDMMLRSLNIDLDVIGYDKEVQRWLK